MVKVITLDYTFDRQLELEREDSRAETLAQGLQAMVSTLKGILPTCDDVYAAVIRNELYADVTRQQMEGFYHKC